MLGTRGIPANYGGFETFAEELSIRLARMGHEVTVYCRRHYFSHTSREYRGVRLAVLPAVRHKYFDTVSHACLSTLHACFRPFDILLVCNAANAVFCWIPRLFGKIVVLNVDGLERKRKKWNSIGKLYYSVSEKLSCFTPTAVVTDAGPIQEYYRARYGKESTMIPYGADASKFPPGKVLRGLGLAKNGYYLYVSRLEPENNAHEVVRMFERVRSERHLLIVGDAPYSREYIRSLKRARDPRVRFAGAIYGDGYRELISNAYCYIHATEVGGTHPALLENMAVGGLVFFLDNPENREAVGDVGVPFTLCDFDRAVAALQEIEDDPARFAPLRESASMRAGDVYGWDRIVRAYTGLFERLMGGRE